MSLGTLSAVLLCGMSIPFLSQAALAECCTLGREPAGLRCLRSLPDVGLRVAWNKTRWLPQRKSRLPITAAFDPLHFIHKPLYHAVAPSQTASISHGFCIITQPIDTSDQFCNPDFLGRQLSIAPTATPLRVCASLWPKSC